ncbi:hypothetical protein TSH58p_22650 (plasmid) [Azospirillum sp. TSH58]|uniref:phage tail length tape measure family protein n=1 Tax=Azospirillum sp. TSH58 TaxID=664962 RepID=UPI000D601B52|nr:phage tail length tape measure family protein [Azospirillum sp. TSH58]AWJ86318.1 hypothetical protein TSH58p_22650 [Azospirillum sp. TSH58]PWC73431.1 hypothetical protein TSH58_04465 [Azospirillum sp. TSH58]
MAEKKVSVRLAVEADRLDETKRKLEELGVAIKSVGNDNSPDKLRRQFEALEGRLDPVSRATQRLARDQATLNTALASGAVSQQRYTELMNASQQAHDRMIAGQTAATASSGQFKGALGNLGLQLQDVTVQAQMGTSAFIILAQQGPQIASAFGPAGIAIGTVVAIASVAAGVIFGLGKTADDTATAFNDYGKALEFTAKLQDELAQATRGQAAAMEAEKRNIIEVRKEALRLAEARMLAARAAAADEEGDGLHTGTGISQSARQSAANRLEGRWKALRDELEILKASAGDYNGMVDRMVQKNQRAATGVTTLDEEITKARQGIVEQTKALGLEADTFGKSNAEKLRATLTQQMLAKEYKTSADQLSEATKQTINDAVAQQDRIDKLEAQKKAQEDATRAGEQAARHAEQEDRKRQQAMRTADIYVDRLRGEADGLELTERERFIANKALELEHQLRGKLSPEVLAEYIRQVEYEAGALYDVTDARKKKTKADEEAARALDAYQREMRTVATDIARDWSETLYDSIVLKDKRASIVDSFRDLFKRIAIEAIKANIVLPITTSIVGSVPGLFGIQSPANQNAANQNGAAGLTGQATDMATNWGMSKAMSWGADKIGLTGIYNGALNWAGESLGLGVSQAATTAAADTLAASAGADFTASVLGGAGADAGAKAAAAATLAESSGSAASAAGGGLSSGGAALSGYLGAAGAGAVGGTLGGMLGTATNSKAVGGLSGAALGAGASSLAAYLGLGAMGGPVGLAIGAVVGGVMGMIGTQKATVGPNAQGNVVISGGRFAEGPSAADNGGDATGVRQATAQIAAAFNAMADAYGLKSPDGTYGLFTGGDKVKGNGVRTPEELIRQLVGSLSADGLVGRALGADVVKGTSDLEQINSYLSLAKRIEATTTALSELDKSLGGVQKAAFKAAADGLSPLLEEMKKAGEIGASAEYKALVSGQVTSLLDDIATPRQYTETQTAVATLTGQLAAWKSVLEQVNPELAKTIDAIEKKGLERIYQGVRTTYDASLNEAQGLGYRNNLQGVRDYWNAHATDMVLAGRDPNALYAAQARQIIDGLTDSQIDDVVSYFRDLDPVMAKLADSLRGTTTAAKEAQKAVQANADSLTAWLNGQKLGDTSSLSPWEKMLEAQRQFDAAISASRQNGDIAGATKAADALLSASRPALVLGTEAYSQREDWITSTLRNLGHELGLPGFKTGGSFEVGGWGGVDSTLVRFMATPGERVTVTRPDQQAQAAERTVVVKDNSDVVRALSQVVNVLSAKLDAVTAELASLKGEQRKGDNLKLAGAA